MQSFLSFFTNHSDILTFFMSLIGFIGTCVGTIRIFWCGRKHISVEILDYKMVNSSVLQFYIYIQNHSTNPLCISRIFINSGDQRYPCELLEKKILTSGELLYRTPLFPLNIPSKVGCMYYLEFLKCNDIKLRPGKNINFTFNTDRGEITKNVILSNSASCLHLH